ncbi:MAG: polysaccharide deacetylase family protein [Polyangiaceae bacterium]|nr:polysaccharide deacetylase family protein [Polyangiaceae bacterium]
MKTVAKRALRDAAATLASLSGLSRADRRHLGHLVIVTFHRVLPAELLARYPYRGLAVTPEELGFILETLGRDYTIATLRDAHRRHAEGERPPKPLLAITFDDGQLDNYEHARPVLAAHGARATFFVPVEALERAEPLWHDRLGFAALVAADRSRGAALRRALGVVGVPFEAGEAPAMLAERAKRMAPPDRRALVELLESEAAVSVPSWAGMMRWDDVRALAREGHEIGSHSMSHTLLPQCDDEVVRFEIAESRARIEAELEAPIDSFCYPNGDYDERAVRALERAGYARAVTTRWGTNEAAAPRFTLHRCDMDALRLRDGRGTLSAALLRLRLSGLHPGL